MSGIPWMDALQWGGCLASIAGGLLLALDNALSRYGWACFLVSNGFWAAFGLASGAGGLVAQQLFFVAINAFGLARWMRPGAGA